MNWSGGKDSALCLHRVLQGGEREVTHLLTSVNEHYGRIAMHGVRVELLRRQAESIGIELVQLLMPEMPSMEVYERLMFETMERLRAGEVTHAVFGDIFLEDLREYRERQLQKIGMRGVFPLWQIPTRRLMEEFIEEGFKAVIVCVDERHLDKSFCGRLIDQSFLDDLPEKVDPCGENGEYHSFVFDAPYFKRPVSFTVGEIVYRRYQPARSENQSDCYDHDRAAQNFETGFYYCDLVPVESNE